MATTGLAHMAKQAGLEAVGLTGGLQPRAALARGAPPTVRHDLHQVIKYVSAEIGTAACC